MAGFSQQKVLGLKFLALNSWRKGFTLIELLIVVTIVSLTMGFFVLILVEVTGKAVQQTAAAEVNEQIP
jgi:prepilin-type N-terminal cleavage/methylation domain-containing protein